MDAANNLWQQMAQYTQMGVDAIQEFAIETSNYASEFGQPTRVKEEYALRGFLFRLDPH